MTTRAGIIGLGAIGGLLVRESLASDPGGPELLVATGRPEQVARHPRVRIAGRAEVAAQASPVFLCVPPDAYPALVEELAQHLGTERVLVSVTNGVPLAAIEARVACPVVKLIPTVARGGVLLLSLGARADAAHGEAVAAFLRPFGHVQAVDARDMRAATNLTGCGPALLACFCELLAEESARRAHSLTTGQARDLMARTLAATGRMVAEGASCEAIMREAATGGGMTQAAMEILRDELPEVMDRMLGAIEARERQLQSRWPSPAE